MFGKAELERLRVRKELLVAQSDVRRLLLIMDCQRLGSMAFWQKEAAGSILKYPLLTASLGAGAGIFLIKSLRHPGTIFKWLTRLGGTGSSLFSVWKMFNRS